MVKLNGQWGYIDKTGREICPIKYDYAGAFFNGLSRVRLNGKWGCVDTTAKEIIPPIFSDIYVTDSVIIAVLGCKFGVLNYNGDYILPCEYDDINLCTDIIIAEKSNISYGFNLDGEFIKILDD